MAERVPDFLEHEVENQLLSEDTKPLANSYGNMCPTTHIDRRESVEHDRHDGNINNPGDIEDGEKRIRRSTRDVKRPKFDDELVDSGIGRMGSGLLSQRRSITDHTHSEFSADYSGYADWSVCASGNAFSDFPSTSAGLQLDMTNLSPIEIDTSLMVSPSNMSTHYLGPGIYDKNDKYMSPHGHEQSSNTNLCLRKRNTISHENRQAMEDAVMEEEIARLERKRKENRVATKDIRAKVIAKGKENRMATKVVPVKVIAKPKKNRKSTKCMSAKEIAAATEAAETELADDLRSWTTIDDIALITAVSHICDIHSVHSNIVFSVDFSLMELEERWYKLMYDDTFSRLAKKRMGDISLQDMLRIQSTTVFSLREEGHLRSVPPFPVPDMHIMADLLRRHAEDFHSARTPQVLLDHWHLLKMSGLINGSKTKIHAQPINWERIENNMSLTGETIFDESRPLRAAAACEIAQQQLALVGIEAVTGVVNETDWPSDVLACVRGRVVRFLIRNERVTMGRSTYKSTADINLALEGPALKVSRRQAVIERQSTGEFYLTNVGRRSLLVDGKTVQQHQQTPLIDKSVIEIAILRLIFRIAPR